MREAREKEQMMKIVCLKNKKKKNAVASRKSDFNTLKILKILRFPVKQTRLIVKRPFPFWEQICQKKSISGLIRVVFGLIEKHPVVVTR